MAFAAVFLDFQYSFFSFFVWFISCVDGVLFIAMSKYLETAHFTTMYENYFHIPKTIITHKITVDNWTL